MEPFTQIILIENIQGQIQFFHEIIYKEQFCAEIIFVESSEIILISASELFMNQITFFI